MSTIKIAIGIIGLVAILAVVSGYYILNNARSGGADTSTQGQDFPVPAQAGGWEEQANNEGAVTIAVVPIGDLNQEGTLNFAVTLSTHSVELRQDLVEVSYLVDGEGNQYKPIAWEGDPPGGHHREGILSFNAVAAQLQTFKIVIRDIEGIPERVFVWEN
jgi:hypothetical protein